MCDAKASFANPMGTVHGGIAATLLDSALGCAVQTTLDDGVAYTTVSLEVKYLRPIRVDAGELRAEATVVHTGRRRPPPKPASPTATAGSSPLPPPPV